MNHTSRWAAGFLVALGLLPLHAADESSKTSVARVEVAQSISPTATLLRREPGAKDWHVVHEKDPLFSGDLFVTGTKGALTSKDGAVRLSAMGEMAGISDFPVHETAVILLPTKDTDLDFTLDRGRVELLNTKKEGAAHVRVHMRDRSALITLPEPGDRLALEVYGRWPRGVHFEKNPGPKHAPGLAVIALALHGQVDIKGTAHEVLLKAPPGPALLFVANLEDTVPSPQFLESLPEWAKDGGKPPGDPKLHAVGKKFRETAIEKSVHDAVQQLVNSDDVHEQRTAMFLMGALDDLKGIATVMRDTKSLEVWDAGVLALRHWIGRGPGQDQKLYHALIEKGGLKPIQAETILQLLHSFGDEERAQPETYQMLIEYLNHPLLSIRGLAYWHLQRLVPEGKKIGYDPFAAKADREKAIAAWHELVPEGKLPPGRQNKDSNKGQP